jgi:hypothetical protein|tara:strand:- start:14 stop:1093 length:1080 start_codon:yes stop_codon:yes gene_type:complete
MPIIEYSPLGGDGGGGEGQSSSTVRVKKGATAQSISPNFAQTILYDEIFDNDGLQYNPLDGSFTALNSGTYNLVASAATLGAWTAGEQQVLELHVNGALDTYLDRYMFLETVTEDLVTQVEGSAILRLEAGDVVQVMLYHNRGIALPIVENGPIMPAGQLNYLYISKAVSSTQQSEELSNTSQSRTEFFNNQTDVSVPFLSGDYPSIDVYVYDSNVSVPELALSVNHVAGSFSGSYNQIGQIGVDSSNAWTLDSQHHLFKHSTLNKYIAFSQVVGAWVYFDGLSDHNLIGQIAEDSAINLQNVGTLPSSYANFFISSNIDQIDTLLMTQASPSFKLDRVGKKVHLSFGSTPQSGILIYK